MQIYSLFMFLGIFSTLLIPETKRITLEKLAGEYDFSGDITGADGVVRVLDSEASAEAVAEKAVNVA
jgi:MFS transporter, PHS family, inorganic phosphate transporter